MYHALIVSSVLRFDFLSSVLNCESYFTLCLMDRFSLSNPEELKITKILLPAFMIPLLGILHVNYFTVVTFVDSNTMHV